MQREQQKTFKIQLVLVGLALALILCACIASGISMFFYTWGGDMARSGISPSGNTQVDELEIRIGVLEQEQASLLRTIAWTLDMKLYYITGAALFISSLAAFFGWKTYDDLEKVIKRRVNVALEEALYQLDPTYLPIHIYKGRVRRNIPEGELPRSTARMGLLDVDKRLKLTGLLNKEYITYLDKVTQTGITIIPIDDEADEEEFIQFINEVKVKINPENAGFILYAPFGYTIKQAQSAFENTAIANMPATVASMVLVVGRGLKNREGIPVKKEEKI
ncbi:MAG: hypothetical protein RBS68_13750 [Anaerolineales bacterium]|jgi:hypothetical protein|nr:hypothetical protein [Anaerolineales bacterium]